MVLIIYTKNESDLTIIGTEIWFWTDGMDDAKTIYPFLSLYTARLSLECYRQVYFVHSGLQDESIQVTISKLP